MNKSAAIVQRNEQTPVDDVRRVRRRISGEAGGDIHRQIEESQRIAELYQDRLGLKAVPAPVASKESRRRAQKSTTSRHRTSSGR
jgi:hypothetical protein